MRLSIQQVSIGQKWFGFLCKKTIESEFEMYNVDYNFLSIGDIVRRQSTPNSRQLEI